MALSTILLILGAVCMSAAVLAVIVAVVTLLIIVLGQAKKAAPR